MRRVTTCAAFNTGIWMTKMINNLGHYKMLRSATCIWMPNVDVINGGRSLQVLLLILVSGWPDYRMQQVSTRRNAVAAILTLRVSCLENIIRAGARSVSSQIVGLC